VPHYRTEAFLKTAGSLSREETHLEKQLSVEDLPYCGLENESYQDLPSKS